MATKRCVLGKTLNTMAANMSGFTVDVVDVAGDQWAESECL